MGRDKIKDDDASIKNDGYTVNNANANANDNATYLHVRI